MSERSELAERIATKIREWHLTTPFGGDVTREKGERCYSVLFARPRFLDGLVQVYSPKFILVQSVGQHGKGSLVFESEANAVAFMQAAFVDFDHEKADAIPVKRKKEKSAS